MIQPCISAMHYIMYIFDLIKNNKNKLLSDLSSEELPKLTKTYPITFNLTFNIDQGRLTTSYSLLVLRRYVGIHGLLVFPNSQLDLLICHFSFSLGKGIRSHWLAACH